MNKKKFLNQLPLHFMILPSALVLLLFSYGAMFGLVMAFQNFLPEKGFMGSEWVGLENFRYLFNLPGVFQVFWNTAYIAILKIILGIIVPVTVALLLNEVRQSKVKRTVQTVIYLPHFMSWVILGGIVLDILSPSTGIVNHILGIFGIEPIFFLGNEKLFPYVMVVTHTWKEFGFGTVIYLAALAGISQNLYEAAVIDGANRWKQTIHITIPSILPIIILMTVLALGNVLNAGFEQIFILYSPQVYSTGDIIDTFVFRLGIKQFQYSTATAVGLLKSVISCVLIVISYKLADRFAGYRIF